MYLTNILSMIFCGLIYSFFLEHRDSLNIVVLIVIKTIYFILFIHIYFFVNELLFVVKVFRTTILYNCQKIAALLLNLTHIMLCGYAWCLYEQRFLFRFVIINCLRLSACRFCQDLQIFLIIILHQYNIFWINMLLAIKFEAGLFFLVRFCILLVILLI